MIPSTRRTARHTGLTSLMGGVALANAGSSVSLLSATAITATAGTIHSGAIDTGLYMAIGLLASALAMPYAPRICGLVGTRMAFAWTSALLAAMWVLVATLLLLGVAPVPVLLAASPAVGALIGCSAVLSPLVFAAYLESGDMAHVVARMTVVKGMATVAGALAGGYFIASENEAAGLLAAGMLRIPLAVFAARTRPNSTICDPRATRTPWRDIRASLRQSPSLRRATLMACGVALFVAPLVSLVVPLTQNLRPDLPLQGAGLLMASIAVGELLSPLVVARLRFGRSSIASAPLASMATGGMLLALALVSTTTSGLVELAAWAALGIGFGATRFASRALAFGAAAEARDARDVANSLAAMLLVACVVAPIGVLMWSTFLGLGAAEVALGVGGVGIVGVGLVVSRHRLKP